MQKRVESDLEEDDAYQAWIGRMQMQHGIDPAWFVLFVGLDAAEGSAGALGSIYRPLQPYPVQGGESLRLVCPEDVAYYAAWAAARGTIS